MTASVPDFPRTARALLEYGAEKEGGKFTTNVKDAVQIAEHNNHLVIHTIAWLFDQSSCH